MGENKTQSRIDKEKTTAYNFGESVGLAVFQVRALRIKFKEKLMPINYWKKVLEKDFNIKK